MSVYVIGDTHLSFSTNKPMNVFDGWDNYVERLERNWQKLITDDDIIVINGDVSWAMNLEEAKADLYFLDKLKGKKIIAKGNHDYWWNTVTKMNAFLKDNDITTISFLFNNAYCFDDFAIAGSRGWFFDAEDDNQVLLRECGRLQRSIDMAKEYMKEIVVFLHYPPVSDGKDCKAIVDTLLENNIKYCYYAHLHGPAHKFAFNGEKYGINFKLVSADYLKFCPQIVKIN